MNSNLKDCWARKLSNGNTEYYSKFYYNADFTRRKEPLDEIEVETNSDSFLYKNLLAKCEKKMRKQNNNENERQILLFKINTILI